jgi:hypothetical protein
MRLSLRRGIVNWIVIATLLVGSGMRGEGEDARATTVGTPALRFYARPLWRANFRASMAAPRAPAVSPLGIT